MLFTASLYPDVFNDVCAFCRAASDFFRRSLQWSIFNAFHRTDRFQIKSEAQFSLMNCSKHVVL